MREGERANKKQTKAQSVSKAERERERECVLDPYNNSFYWMDSMLSCVPQDVKDTVGTYVYVLNYFILIANSFYFD